MAYDYIYYFDKVRPYNRHRYGEIQQNSYNMSFVIDGTKDSTKIIVINFEREELKPNTIVWLEKTNTWWIVDKDRVERHTHENKPIYKHEIQLLGAIDILNARDLTNCGFNRERYTIGQMLNRLISLTDFEFETIFVYGSVLNSEIVYNYVKSFDNYSPLSAIREICDGFNCVPKMTFQTNNLKQISRAVINFYSKSGNQLDVFGNKIEDIDIEDFSDARETITNDKENYGTRVVSNVENCISSVSVDYPSIGAGRLSSDENQITRKNAIFRLPSPAFKVNSITFTGKFNIFYINERENRIVKKEFNNSVLNYGVVDEVISFMLAQTTISSSIQYINFNREKLKQKIKEVASIKIEDGGSYDWDFDEWNEPYVKLHFREPNFEHEYYPPIVLNSKKMSQIAKQSWRAITWEQGSDIISNFTFFDEAFKGFIEWVGDKKVFLQGHRWNENTQAGGFPFYSYGYERFVVDGCFIDAIGDYRCWVNVNYVPMSDIKLKVDNDLNSNDTKLFNQNGKLIDGSAVSKLVNAYSKIINSNEITRFKTYYNFNDIPKVGQIVNDNGKKYVVNNLSIDLIPNDNGDYIYYCEFTMTLQNACKSTLIQANTNIRDYKCPQENNIKRVQLYRDYFELGYENNTPNYESYIPFNDLFNFGKYTKGEQNIHNAFVKATSPNFEYENCYYQLYSSKVYLDKMFVENIDFKDNNIIGYGYLSSFRIPEITHWWRWNNYLNIPISYVDSYGELEGLEILLLDKEQIVNTYNKFVEITQDITLDDITNIQTCISRELYECAKGQDRQGIDYDMIISEPHYKKDGLEIPVFQYVAQVGDANDIVFGSDFLKAETCVDNEFIEYSYFVSDCEITNENYKTFDTTNIVMSGNEYSLNNKVEIRTFVNSIILRFYNYYSSNVSTGEVSGNVVDYNIKKGDNIGIVFNKCKYDSQNNTITRQSYLLFAINRCKNNLDANGELRLFVNNWKLR